MPANTSPESIPPVGIPVVAIAGRPNVGKSALFNRLLGRRLAIVHEECGVTRDRVIASGCWNGFLFELIDTGGITEFGRERSEKHLDAETRRQSEAAIQDASVVILVTGADAGLTPLDREVARLVRKSGTRIIVAVNKCDHPDRDSLTGAFEALGFPVHGVSALHNRGIDELMTDVTRGWPRLDSLAQPEPLRISVVGKPNAGKSSFLNRLVQKERLIVSEIPGTTRDTIDIPFQFGTGPTARQYLLTDTAGMRHMGKVEGAVERFSIYRAEGSIQRSDIVILMLDASQGPTAQDKAIANTVMDANKGCIVIVNKWDLVKHVTTQKEYRDALERVVPFLRWVPFLFLSAKEGFHLQKCMETINLVAENIQTRIPTATLNRVITAAHGKVQPPMLQGKRFKIYYATQTAVRPVTIHLFVNDPERLTQAYHDYLLHALRRQFGLEGAPILLVAKARPRGEFTPAGNERRNRRRSAQR